MLGFEVRTLARDGTASSPQVLVIDFWELQGRVVNSSFGGGGELREG